MSFQAIAYTVFTISLAVVMAGIIIYYYNPARRQEVEEPKLRMLRDDD
ncbi:MAG: cbb3-type cytochrome c oxidase subunit 3 [Chlorobiaceae bacterium]|nr:cbb3-type cytochrome c oxidase subunit 3 [Chlorobiaceae bacterium]NTW73403.1 cbb3-type cytochrome c oxidase subunit 3 [Chlorobiaceae bacterium]